MMEDKDLAAVLQAARKNGEISYEKLSAQCGGKPTAKRLHQLANAPLRNFPDPDTITHLARGTGQSITAIVMASARSLGLNVTSDDPDTVRLAGSSTYPPALLDAFRELGEQITTALAEERDGRGNAAPITRAGESPAAQREDRERASNDPSLASVSTFPREKEIASEGSDEDAATYELVQEDRSLGNDDSVEVREGRVSGSKSQQLTGRSALDDLDDLARRRREREAGQEAIPLPDEDRMAGYDAPSEGRAMREQQDADAEGPQD